jgi:hypothetical protein
MFFSGDKTGDPEGLETVKIQMDPTVNKSYIEESAVMTAIQKLDEKFDSRLKDITNYFMSQLL